VGLQPPWRLRRDDSAAQARSNRPDLTSARKVSTPWPPSRPRLCPERYFWKHKNTYLRHSGPEHIMAFSPTRFGKGVGLVAPTLLSWGGSTVIYEIEGKYGVQ